MLKDLVKGYGYIGSILNLDNFNRWKKGGDMGV